MFYSYIITQREIFVNIKVVTCNQKIEKYSTALLRKHRSLCHIDLSYHWLHQSLNKEKTQI